ncbi:MAG: hypothetical protein M0002_14115 [Rhodospirillales bacterium]|nr:hypothetical protein [Rhodospirillales bacterium]
MQRREILVAALAAPLLGMGSAAAPPVKLLGNTARYRLELDIGPLEHMYSPAEAARSKPMQGEIMVAGRMSGMTAGKMAMPAGMGNGTAMRPSVWHHLELHVWDKISGAVVKDAHVSIRVIDLASGRAQTVPIAAMYGIHSGPADWHYGNNVRLPPGHWRVDAVVNGEAASFTVTIPPG